MSRALLSLALFGLLLAVLPFIAPRGLVLVATEAAAVLAIAVSWNLLASFGGIVLIGMPLFVGCGAYALYALANAAGVAPHLLIPVAGLGSGLLALILSPVLFRLSGAQLAIGSWVMAEVGRILVLQSEFFGAGGGLNLHSISEVPRALRIDLGYAAAASVAFAAIIACYLLMRSRWGLALRAIRDSENAAAAVGIEIRQVQRYVLVLAAALTGMAAGAFYISALQVTPTSAFGIGWMAVVIFVVVLGGIGSLEGPIIGTVVYFGLREAFADQGELYFVVLGALAISVTIFAPRGLWGLVRRLIGIDLLPIDRVPSPPSKSLPAGRASEPVVRNS